MRVLLDESLPRQMARELTDHQVRTVRQENLQGLKNGELLRRAQETGFDIFVTADQNLEYQQNLARAEIGIIIVRAISNRIEDLLPLVPKILGAISKIQPRQVTHIG